MVYTNKFVLTLLIDGKIQKDRKNGTVEIPFGSEYALRLRNKHDRRAVAIIYIDGENVSSGGYVIGPKDSIDVKRHNDKDRAFKFVDLDSEEAYDAGKNGENDDKEKGTIEVRFFLEEKDDDNHNHIHHHHHHNHNYPRPDPFPIKPYGRPWHTTIGDSVTCGLSSVTSSDAQGHINISSSGDVLRGTSPRSRKSAISTQSMSKGLEDGCTVEGSHTGQKFETVSIELEKDYVALKLFLQGYVSDEPVQVQTDGKYCDGCGAKKAKKKAKFCSNCGNKF